MSVASEQVPDGYIIDPERVIDVAYAGKEQRCLAAAARLVDSIISPHLGEVTTENFVRDAGIAAELFEAMKLYPEAFRHVSFNAFGKVDQKVMLRAVPEIMQYGGLPLEYSEHGNSKIGADVLEAEAEVREQIAIALLDTPPSDEFKKDFDVRISKFDKDPANIVFGLLGSSLYHANEAKKAEKYYQSQVGLYEADAANWPKMERIINMLKNTWLTLDDHNGDRARFRAEVEEAFNARTTTLADLEAHWARGNAMIVSDYKQKAARKQKAYEMILSGEAAVYKSPVSQ